MVCFGRSNCNKHERHSLQCCLKAITKRSVSNENTTPICKNSTFTYVFYKNNLSTLSVWMLGDLLRMITQLCYLFNGCCKRELARLSCAPARPRRGPDNNELSRQDLLLLAVVCVVNTVGFFDLGYIKPFSITGMIM